MPALIFFHSTMTVSNFALLGLDADHRIVWRCDRKSSSLPTSLNGKLLSEAFPKLPNVLDVNDWTTLSSEGEAPPIAVRSHKVECEGLAWILEFDGASGSSQKGFQVAPTPAHLFQGARNEIMTELHRGGQQVLSALLMRLGGMGKTGSEDDMREIRFLVAKAQADMRTLTQTIAPTALKTHGLSAALARLADVLDEEGEVSLVVPRADGYRFDEAAEIAAYEVIRGIVVRLAHEGLTSASVTLHTYNGILRIIIELNIVVTQETIEASPYCQQLLAQTGASIRSDVDSTSTTVVLEFPEGSLL